MVDPHSHVHFIRIGDEIINLANVARIERSLAGTAGPTTVLIYSIGDDRSDSRFTGAQADAIWKKFSAIAEVWDVPDAQHTSSAGPGRIDRPT